MKIVIVRYNAGNVLSVKLALKRLGHTAVISDEPDELRAADRVIFPGQGEALSAMRYLREKGLDEVLRKLQQPVLGICLGLQLMAESSEENNAPGLGLIPGRVRRFPDTGKVPHMGWNNIRRLRGPLFDGVPENSYVYFVHGYYMECNPFMTAEGHYLCPFAAAVQKDNFYAVQFHPEKSAATGERILHNFLTLT